MVPTSSNRLDIIELVYQERRALNFVSLQSFLFRKTNNTLSPLQVLVRLLPTGQRNLLGMFPSHTPVHLQLVRKMHCQRLQLGRN
jgi:hypothetical protein